LLIKRNILNTDIRMHENNNGLLKTNQIIKTLNREMFDIKSNTSLIQQDIGSLRATSPVQSRGTGGTCTPNDVRLEP
jgi:hypothetical protein